MLILKEKEIYLIDRDNNVFAAPQFHFPQRKLPKEHVYDTLLDGVSPDTHLKGPMSSQAHARVDENHFEIVGKTFFSNTVGEFRKLFSSV